MKSKPKSILHTKEDLEWYAKMKEIVKVLQTHTNLDVWDCIALSGKILKSIGFELKEENEKKIAKCFSNDKKNS